MKEIVPRAELQEKLDEITQKLWEWEEKHDALREELLEIFEEYSEHIKPVVLAYYRLEEKEETP